MGPRKEPAEFLGQLHGLTQEHWHHFLGSFMGPHKSTGNISWPVARAHTVSPAPFFGELHGPTESNQQNFLGGCLGRYRSTGTNFWASPWAPEKALATCLGQLPAGDVVWAQETGQNMLPVLCVGPWSSLKIMLAQLCRPTQLPKKFCRCLCGGPWNCRNTGADAPVWAQKSKQKSAQETQMLPVLWCGPVKRVPVFLSGPS